MIQRLWSFFMDPMPRIRLSAFRIAMGLAGGLYLGFRFCYAQEWLTGRGFHLGHEAIGFYPQSFPLLPEQGVVVFQIVMALTFLCFIAGWAVRWSGLALLAGVIYVTYADPLAAFSPNKILIVSLAVITLGEWLRYPVSGPEGAKSYIYAWPVRVLQITFLVHLFCAGWVKIVFGEWYQEPLVMWSQIQGTYRTEFAAFLLRHLPLRMWGAIQDGGLVYELVAPFLFLIPRTRTFAIVSTIVFQLSIAVLMAYLIFFNLIMLSFLWVFISPGTLAAIKDRWTGTVIFRSRG